MIRVLLAEDSLTVRQLLVEQLQSDSGIEVVGQANNGAEAVELAWRLRPDIVAMDVHMPVLDGLDATKEIMVRSPVPIVLISSSSSPGDVELALNAMRAGALMVLEKPDDPRSARFDGRRQQLIQMVKAMAQVKVVRRWAPRRERTAAPAAPPRRGDPIRLVAVAASTGGPAVLQRVLSDLPGDFPAPVLVVQHIATGFVGGLADWLNGSSALRVKVAEDGEALMPHVAYLSPDNRHLGAKLPGHIELSDAPPVGGFRPSGTYLFESAARLRGPALAALILTGMGSDGVAGLHKVREAGGTVLAQDEESSVVFGMPRDAVAAGVVNAVLGVEEIAPRLVALAREA
ncbi:MAG: chemotaxis-specific protein-glutamate methyltransferase CheB [Gemmatimonadales bacterium]